MWTTYKVNARWLHRFRPSSDWHLGHMRLSIGGLYIFSYCKCFMWTTHTDTSKWPTQIEECYSVHNPLSLQPQVIFKCLGRVLFFSGSRFIFLIMFCSSYCSNDAVFPEHICTDRWCERTRIVLTTSEKPAWNANVTCRKVKQGKSGTDFTIWLPYKE